MNKSPRISTDFHGFFFDKKNPWIKSVKIREIRGDLIPCYKKINRI